ncbi:FAD-binding oxidoreductase [Corynebacterium sp. CCUG 65737]|uniref:FAD-binding and (Fe-S)-binding domain-containing protein n=1 Tax=Corynebacterium sp. CCUG 65737 TaxID=2823889 RepID=UPI00210D5033|nr:FAD-binding and (Fe-S)-binding domain-containing protein [Corynebacterium sp. CCUG 65737]MCQ4618496.1 FAD-binding oxidoreductase [Corynebacterium pseudogenitalium]MCQ4627346.1 FAD-binding oxidoreductase [Corynebacterium sp. CCUG 65737]
MTATITSPAAHLARELGSDQTISTRQIDRIKYAHDASHFLYTPQVVAEARNANDVAAAFRASASSGTPVVLRAGGTSLSGQAGGGGMLVDVRKHFRGVEVLDAGKRVRVQPGSTVRQVNAHLAPYGRKLGPDPASEGAATLGGVISNNSSGMACGTQYNTYNTLESLTFVLPSGTVIDTAHADAEAQFAREEPELAEKLEQLKRRVRGNAESVKKIEQHFALKNTMGYSLNAFLDYESPLEIFTHLLVASEGTLAFIAEAVLRTVEVPKLKTTTIAVYPTIDAATRSLPALFDSKAATLELMDSRSIAVGRGFDSVPEQITGFELDQHAALLIEYHANEEEQLREYERAGTKLLGELDLATPAEFSTDPKQAAKAWAFRKGLYAQVAEARPSGTTALLEDIAVPVEDLADTCGGLQGLFDEYSYDDAVIFGHAKDGNIHFLITDRFEGDENLGRYDGFNEAMVDLVLGAGGNLKAEHGTGRVMAPYVRRQYGDELYEVMVELKRAVDPRGVMNPGVIITDDDREHMKNFKLNPQVEDEIDSCVECGYCEPVCPSRDLTMTPRQRIVVRRARAKAIQEGDTELVKHIDAEYQYEGIDTCAVDSMCVTACPVGIDTGKFIKSLRRGQAGAVESAGWAAAAKAWGPGNKLASTALTGAYYLPSSLVEKVTGVARALVGEDTVPSYRPELTKGGASRAKAFGTHIGDPNAEPVGVFVPACVNSMFGPQGEGIGASAAFAKLVERAGLSLVVPEGIDGMCCGTPWASKGMAAGHDIMQSRVNDELIAATDGGRLPVIVDATSCTHGFQDMAETIGITVIDAVAFVGDKVVDKLDVTDKIDSITLHPTCSAAHLSLIDDLSQVAAAAAETVNVPPEWNCCGYAGDRGMLHPELTQAATKREAEEVAGFDSQCHASSNRTCELGLTAATGKDYEHVLEVLERVSR